MLPTPQPVHLPVSDLQEAGQYNAPADMCELPSGNDDIIFVEHLPAEVTELAALPGDRRRSRNDHQIRRKRGGDFRGVAHATRGGVDRRRDRDRFHARTERCEAGVSEELSPNSAFPEGQLVVPAEELTVTPLQPSPHWSTMFPMMGQGNPNPMMAMPSHGFNQFGFMGPTDGIMPVPIPGPTKEIIQCKNCTLFPPNPNGPPPSTRERPPGCRTAFVGGLPENITEEIIREIFDRFGESSTIRMSKKNFCHIRYENECFVDYAICLSGYRVRINGSTEPPNTGRLHVDYAQARDDLYEWECRQRQLQREYRHRERMEQERLRPPSPPSTRVVHYSEHEATLLGDRLKAAVHAVGPNGAAMSQDGMAMVISAATGIPATAEELFQKAVQTLIVWLERGDCSKRNAGSFYGMIQSTNAQVRRLINDKRMYEEEMQAAKEKLRQRINAILVQFNQIEKVFGAASHQKVWDHFTKAQRKNIDAWKKLVQEFRQSQMDDGLGERMSDEMDFSDEEDDEVAAAAAAEKKMRFDYGAGDDERVCELSTQLHNLKEENDSLRCQLEAYKNEVDLIKSDGRVQLDEQGQQTKALKQALEGMQQQLILATQQKQKDEEALQSLRKKLNCPEDAHGEIVVSNSVINLPIVESLQPLSAQPRLLQEEAKLIGLVSTFLHVHPFGANVDYIWSYLHCLDASLKTSDVESLLLKFPTVFKQEMSGVGASLERKWVFTGFAAT